MIHSPLYIFAVLSFFFSCNKNETTSDNTSNTVQSEILGYWILKSGTSYAINSSGAEIVTATLKEKTFAHEFKKDGTCIGYDLTGSLLDETYKWEIINIEKGEGAVTATLNLWNDYTLDNKDQIFINSEGKLSYIITLFATTPPEMNLETRRYEGYPHKENWVEYKYIKGKK